MPSPPVSCADHLETLKDLFGTQEIRVEASRVVVGDRDYPIVDGVIVLLDPSHYTGELKDRLRVAEGQEGIQRSDFSEEVQFSFSEEWREFPRILPEHEQEFRQYFDLVDQGTLEDARVCDLGCGIGRWSYFLKDRCRELILVDFSEAIFVARRNLQDVGHALFFMADLKGLPFREDFADFVFCLGVLHYLPTPALDEVRELKKYAPRLLVYLYYALDNRPSYFRLFHAMASKVRRVTARQRSPFFRNILAWFFAAGVYLPLVLLGSLLRPFGLSEYVPLYEGYRQKSLDGIRQDAYNRFFTPKEQRCSRQAIMGLTDTYSRVVVSDSLPYWHFLCER